MKRIVAPLLVALFVLSAMPVANAASGRAVNIDLAVSDISVSYPDSVNESLYKMFSSNYPIIGFNKPESLYVTDGVVGVEINLNIVIDNLGTVQSGFVDVEVLVLHNEYTRFELLNTSKATSPITGSSSGSVDILWTPYYSGNHTLLITVSNTNGDDDPSNNLKSRHMTIAHSYDNCVDMSAWTSTGDWIVNSDTFISQSNSFHIGNGQYSTYSPLTTSTLTSPVLNLADDTPTHNAAIGYSFFYTGAAGSGDQMKGYIKDETGNWDETFTMQGVIDNNLLDGTEWQTFSAAYNGRNSPLIPVDGRHFHTTTQLRFQFTSDSIGEDIGFWMDDLVIIYDQAAKKKEYQVQLTGINALGGLPGDWSTTRMEITNTGNISARYTPIATGIPAGWTHFFSNPNGVSISSSGMELLPGEKKQFDLRVEIPENESQQNIQVNVNVTSNRYSDVESGISTVIKILPDRLPNIVLPEFTPRCTPGNTCSFPVTVENIGDATDVFTLSVTEKNLPTGWQINLALNQSTNILVRIDTPQHVWMTATIPLEAEPDVTGEVWLTATSTNDSRRFDQKAIEVAAAMISNAEVSPDNYLESNTIDAGSSVEVKFRIWNNASRIDIFTPIIDHNDVTGWTVELLNSPDLAISPGSSSTYTVRITAPITGQAGDVGPAITPKAMSLRSGQEITGQIWQELKVNTLHDLAIELLDSPIRLDPGTPMLIQLKVTNNGNGEDNAILDLPWTADSWEWWAISDGENVTMSIPLSVSYDLENEKMIDLWILLPTMEAPGEFHEITISVSSQNGLDQNPSDNSVLFEAVTEIKKEPRLDGYVPEIVAETNSTQSFSATAWNIGNAADSTIKARLVIQTSPPSNEVLGFISTNNGLSKSAGEWLNLNLGPTESVELIADIIISSNCELNTIISATIELVGGEDELGRPITKTLSAAILVGDRRSVDLVVTQHNVAEVISENSKVVWYNFSSTSTQNEIFEISANTPEGWGMICDGVAIHLESYRIEMGKGHLTKQKHDMRCSVIRESGDYTGKVIVNINNSDGRFSNIIDRSYNWDRPVEDQSNSVVVIGSSISGVLIVCVVVYFIVRSRSEDEFFDGDEDVDTDQIETNGPPASINQYAVAETQLGPPSTQLITPQENTAPGPTASAVPVVDPAMVEYQRQLEEYNKKMAEYEAWQNAQN